jgi:hypothetical protein
MAHDLGTHERPRTLSSQAAAPSLTSLFGEQDRFGAPRRFAIIVLF